MNFKLEVVKKLIIGNLQLLKEKILSDSSFNFEQFNIYKFGNEAITKAVFDVNQEKLKKFK